MTEGPAAVLAPTPVSTNTPASAGDGSWQPIRGRGRAHDLRGSPAPTMPPMPKKTSSRADSTLRMDASLLAVLAICIRADFTLNALLAKMCAHCRLNARSAHDQFISEMCIGKESHRAKGSFKPAREGRDGGGQSERAQRAGFKVRSSLRQLEMRKVFGEEIPRARNPGYPVLLLLEIEAPTAAVRR